MHIPASLIGGVRHVESRHAASDAITHRNG